MGSYSTIIGAFTNPLVVQLPIGFIICYLQWYEEKTMHGPIIGIIFSMGIYFRNHSVHSGYLPIFRRGYSLIGKFHFWLGHKPPPYFLMFDVFATG